MREKARAEKAGGLGLHRDGYASMGVCVVVVVGDGEGEREREHNNRS